jgi:hypothetical protein
MKQMSFASTDFERSSKRTHKREFLDEMNLVVPWAELVALIALHGPFGQDWQAAVSCGDDAASSNGSTCLTGP